jgi:hypothetical protein
VLLLTGSLAQAKLKTTLDKRLTTQANRRSIENLKPLGKRSLERNPTR